MKLLRSRRQHRRSRMIGPSMNTISFAHRHIVSCSWSVPSQKLYPRLYTPHESRGLPIELPQASRFRQGDLNGRVYVTCEKFHAGRLAAALRSITYQIGELLDGNRYIRCLRCATTRSGNRYGVCPRWRPEIYLAAPAVTTTAAKYHSQEADEHDESERSRPALLRSRDSHQENPDEHESGTYHEITWLIRTIPRLELAAQACRS